MSNDVNDFLSETVESYGVMERDLEKLGTEDIQGGSFVVNGFKLLDSEHGDGKYAAVDVSVGDKHFFWTTGSGVIKKQLLHNANAGNLPFRAGLEERKSQNSSNTYLTFVGAS